jgi:hypothetical protein
MRASVCREHIDEVRFQSFDRAQRFGDVILVVLQRAEGIAIVTSRHVKKSRGLMVAPR